MATCPAAISQGGTPERVCPVAESTALTASGPSIHPALSPQRISPSAAPRPSSASRAKPGGAKGMVADSSGKSPRSPASAIRLGTSTTTETTRSSCATATGAPRPP